MQSVEHLSYRQIMHAARQQIHDDKSKQVELGPNAAKALAPLRRFAVDLSCRAFRFSIAHTTCCRIALGLVYIVYRTVCTTKPALVVAKGNVSKTV